MALHKRTGGLLQRSNYKRSAAPRRDNVQRVAAAQPR